MVVSIAGSKELEGTKSSMCMKNIRQVILMIGLTFYMPTLWAQFIYKPNPQRSIISLTIWIMGM